MKNKSLWIILIIAIVVITVVGIIKFSSKEPAGMQQLPREEEIEVVSKETVNNTQTIENQNYSTSAGDETAIKTENNGVLELKNTSIYKAGDTSSLRNSDAQGLNSAVLARKGTQINVSEVTVTTAGKGASAIVSNGSGAKAEVEATQIVTEGERSRGLLANGGGTLTASDVEVETKGYKSSGIATDTGGGSVTVDNSKVITNGEDSAGIYSTGTVLVRNTKVETKKSEAIVIDGYNIADVNNCEIVAGGKRGAMLIYTGPSGHQKTTGILKLRNSTLTAKEGPAIYVTNTNGDIYISNTKLNIASGILLEVCVDKYGELGQEHPVDKAEGGKVELEAEEQTLVGEIIADSESSVELELTDTTYTGKINRDNTAEAIKVTIGENSTWNLTGDSYVSELNTINGGKVNQNGYNLYVNGKKM